MLDPDVPPEVEGDTDGGVGVVLLAEAVQAVANQTVSAKPTAASIPPPWIIAIGRILAATTMGRAAADRDPVSAAHTSPRIRNLFPELLPKTWRPGSSRSSTTCSSWPRSRKPLAR